MKRLVEEAMFFAPAFLLGAYLACGTTPPAPVPAPAPADAGPPLDLVLACASLADAGCPEAIAGAGGEPCAARLERESELVNVPATCLAGSNDPAILRACGADAAVPTVRFRCTGR